ncbi:alkaline phosphatase family protein [Tenuifilum osseticum]|uniref:alkaline phosphatase family protein n=1 Tax=Tenuifilum osseticum TaxID=3374723 RepID=UPI0034E44D0A
MKRFFAIIPIIASGILLVFSNTLRAQDKVSPDSYVLLISLDGFRWDYPNIYSTPNIDAFGQSGVRAQSLISCYPSKTFPNHYSIATGLHPDHHGIVNNSFYDPELGYYRLGDRKSVENGKFYGGEPIWVTAEKQGVKTASFYWVGSEAPIQGIQPTYWKRYAQKVPFTQRVDTVLKWFTLPVEQRPRLVTFYYHEPDWVSHDYGPVSPQTRKVVEQLDSLIGYFLNRLSELPIAGKLNIIILSDHGMAAISSQKVVNLSDYLDKQNFKYISGGNPVYTLQPQPEHYQAVLTKLKSIPHLKVWERNEIPKRYVYGSNPRVNDILVEAELGWSVTWSDDKDSYSGGTHGYDNLIPDMQGIFYAKGPAFKNGYVHPSFLNVNVYTILAHILGLNPANTDGSMEEVAGMLK